MGREFTIKDFRTYASNLHFVQSLLHETNKRLPKTNKIILKNLVNAFTSTAKYLRHTKSISKKSYVVGFIVDMYKENPDFFIARKHEQPIEVLLKLLSLYKNKIISSRKKIIQ